MKIKLIFTVIFTYILLIGCEDNVQNKCVTDNFLELDAPSLQKVDGYYKLEYLHDYIQTFTTLKASTNSTDQHQKLTWVSNKEILIH